MKKIFNGLLLALTTVLMLSACSKDKAELIVGTWIVDCDKSTTHEEYIDPELQWEDDYSLMEQGCVEASYTFNADGSGSVYTRWSDNGEEYTDPLTYTIDGDKLILNKGLEEYEIVELSKKQMVLVWDAKMNPEPNVDYNYHVYMVMNRK